MAAPVASAGPAGRAIAWLGGLLFVVSLTWFLYCYAVVFGRITGPRAPGLQDLVPPVLINLAMFTVFALHHSVMARSGAKRWLGARIPPVLERSSYVWISSAAFLLTCAAWQPVPGLAWRADGAGRWILHGVQLAGLWLILRSAGVIDIWDLSGIRQAQGWPATTRFVDSGPYGLVRHPIYLGWVLLTFGAPTMTGTRLAFAVISTAYLMIAVPFEERSMIETFGERYRRYQREVRWRMVPGIY